MMKRFCVMYERLFWLDRYRNDRLENDSSHSKMAESKSFTERSSGCTFVQNKSEMSYYCINLELPTYLRQWLVHENGGKQPIVFPRLSTENKILKMGLIKTPFFARPDRPTENSVAISIPFFRVKPPKTYNYLPRMKCKDLANCIRDRFIIQLWTDLHRHGNIGKRKDNLIYNWMTANGIENTEKNWNAIAKIYQRQHKNYLAGLRNSKKCKK